MFSEKSHYCLEKGIEASYNQNRELEMVITVDFSGFKLLWKEFDG